MKLNYFVNLETTLLGFKDEENNIVIPAKYNAVSEFNEGYAVFEYNIHLHVFFGSLCLFLTGNVHHPKHAMSKDD